MDRGKSFRFASKLNSDAQLCLRDNKASIVLFQVSRDIYPHHLPEELFLLRTTAKPCDIQDGMSVWNYNNNRILR